MPDKYGIIFFFLNNVKLKYAANITLHVGAQEIEQHGDVLFEESVVLKFTEHIKKKAYIMHSNNFFTFQPLAEKVGKEKAFMFGTIQNIRKKYDKNLD